MDAQVAYGFHHLRDEKPYLAQGPIANKVYFDDFLPIDPVFLTVVKKNAFHISFITSRYFFLSYIIYFTIKNICYPFSLCHTIFLSVTGKKI